MSIVENLRDSRKRPSILRLKVLKIRGERPDILIFIHEGIEDIPVYEAWLSRINHELIYEPVPGTGKEQVLSFYASIIDDELSRNVAFFVDRDFDLEQKNKDRIYELPAYSIENLLCVREAIDSVLKDEFRCAGAIEERSRIIGVFGAIQENFRIISDCVNFQLFVARREGVKVLKKPDSSSEIAIIELETVSAAFADCKEICEIEGAASEYRLVELRKEFDSLAEGLRNRGKYELDLLKRWLRRLSDDKRSDYPKLFGSPGRVQGDPGTLSMRRLAIASPLPGGLSDFVQSLLTQGPGGAAA